MSTRVAGLCIPVFSLRSKRSLGVGDFGDLKLCIKWAKKAGLKLVQILPVNDTSHSLSDGDGYPYSILSSFALHPIYLDVQALAPPDMDGEIEVLRAQLDAPRLAYYETYLAKLSLIQKLFALRAQKDFASSQFKVFFKESEEWLKPYAAFCMLRDRYGTSDFRTWERFACFDAKLVEEICVENFRSVSLIYFTQYHLHCQFQSVKACAEKEGVMLKGDFPIGVHENSLEAWIYPQYFRWNQTIGAPPDFYNSLGQNWGFPSYDWEKIKEDGFEWLRLRLNWFERYFHALRLDHVLGYFRLWEVPISQVRGLMGIFYPSLPYTEEELKAAGVSAPERLSKPYESVAFDSEVAVRDSTSDPKEQERLYSLIEDRCFLREGMDKYHPRIDLKSTQSFKSLPSEQQAIVMDLFTRYFEERQADLWREKGREKLAFMQKQTGLLLCAEDIGVIPNCVEEVLKELQMPNLYVQRMPKDFALEFEDLQTFPELSVCTPSNHDTHTLRAFWELDGPRRKRYAKMQLGMDNPLKSCTPEIAEAIIRAHLHSPSRFAIFLMQDLLAIDESLRAKDPFSERINDPADPHYRWDWRLHLTLEELLESDSFTAKIKELAEEAKR